MVSKTAESVCIPFMGDSIGGSLISSIYLIKALQECDDLNVIVPVGGMGEGAKMLMASGICVQIWPELAKLGYGGSLGSRIFKLVFSIVWAGRRIVKERLTIVHTNDAATHMVWSIACRILGCRHIWHQRTRLSYSRVALFGLLCTRQILCISEYVQSTIPQFARAKSTILVNPIDASIEPGNRQRPEFQTLAANYKKRNVRQKVLVGFVGAFNQQKRVLDVIKIARELKQEKSVYFLIMGKNGDLSREFLQELVSRNGLSGSVTLWPFIENVRAVLNFCDIVVAPSEAEASGRVILEAIDAGAIVIASKSGGHSEIVMDGITGYLAEIGDIRHFSTVILRYSDQEEDFDSIRTQARSFVYKVHSRKQFSVGLVDIYRNFPDTPTRG